MVDRREVLDVIYRHGSSANPITNERICRHIGIPYGNDSNGPKVRKAVEKLRAEGFPICANSSGPSPGYWVAEDWEQLHGYADRLRGRIRSIQATLDALLRYGRERFGPEETGT